MNKIITIGREFGSGGRELGRRLAERLGVAYYDQEIIQEIARRTAMSEEYIQRVVEQKPTALLPITIGHTFQFTTDGVDAMAQTVYREQSDIIRELAAKSDCVIVGRCADYILRESNPTRIFVYADMESKIRRCFERAPENEHLTEKEMRQYIQKVDKNRAVYYEFYTGRAWGDWHNYDLCINTSGKDIKALVDSLTLLQR